MRSFKTCLLLGAAAILVFGGCESSHNSSSASSGGQGKADRGITSQIRSDLNHDPVYKFDDVGVTTANGVVQLSGFAGTEDQKRRAAEIAQSVEGVTQVQNAITLKPNALSRTGKNYGTTPPYP